MALDDLEAKGTEGLGDGFGVIDGIAERTGVLLIASIPDDKGRALCAFGKTGSGEQKPAEKDQFRNTHRFREKWREISLDAHRFP